MIYASPSSPLGSISAVYERLTTMGINRPVTDNKEGSYITMF